MNQADLSKLYNDALAAYDAARDNRKRDPGAYETAREALGDVVQASAQWTARIALSTLIEHGAASLRMMDANAEFLLSRVNVRPRPARALPRTRAKSSRRAAAR